MALEVDGGTWEPQPTVYLSHNKVYRYLKKERNSLYNCIRSVIDDAEFVLEVSGLYPGLPLLANLRCGRWYTRRPTDTCYFKSTDGHNGRWGFSLVRLNLHVAQLAGQHGGVLIVDATRNANKGGFPDALSKTIPIWSCVLNRAVMMVRSGQRPSHQVLHPPQTAQTQDDCQQCGGGQGSTAQDTAAATEHLVCISGGDTETVTGTLLDGTGWDTNLHFPLWISRNERMQVEAKLDTWAADLLATNYQAVADLEQVLLKPLRPLWLSQNSRIWVDQVAQPSDLPFHPLVLVTASKHVHTERRPCPSTRRQIDAMLPTEQEQEPTQTATYMYLPGAGDDEECWATGLTPDMLWNHEDELLSVSAAELHVLVSGLVKRYANPAAAAQRSAPVCTHTTALTDEHHLAPVGCRVSPAAAITQHLGGGAYAISGTSLVIGGWSSGQPPHVWNVAPSVLYLGTNPSNELQDDCGACKACEELTGQPVQMAAPTLVTTSTTHDIQPDINSNGRQYLWLPCTQDKHSAPWRAGNTHCRNHHPRCLHDVLPDAVPWVLNQARNGPVLIHDDTGVDLCVSVATAVLLASQASPGHVLITKDDVRRALATVANSYPQARPTRSQLKQVYAFWAGDNSPG